MKLLRLPWTGAPPIRSYMDNGYIPLEDMVEEAFHTNEQTSTIGKSTISISKPSDENAPKGTFQVEATTDPGTTTVHTFRVHCERQALLLGREKDT